MKEAKQDHQSGSKHSAQCQGQDFVRSTAALWLWGPPNVLVMV